VQFYDITPSPIQAWEWNIDGEIFTDSTFSTNLAAGDYTVELRVLSEAGCYDVINREITIIGEPVAAFTPSQTYGSVPLTVDFSNESEGAQSYLWHFGDANGTTSNEVNPQFEYIAAGSYEVELISSISANSCADTTTLNIDVVEPSNVLSINQISIADGGNILLKLENSGSYLYTEDNLMLIFSFDNSASFSEPLKAELQPQTTLDYSPSFTLDNSGNAKSLCLEVVYREPSENLSLDSNCLNLVGEPVISDIYPNPATDQANFNVVLPVAAIVNINLLDSGGNIVFTSSFDGVSGLNPFTIQTTAFRAGLYFLQVQAGENVSEMKIVIAN
jgi:PKD repeat protein